MPSPVGHALAAFAVGQLIAPDPFGDRTTSIRQRDDSVADSTGASGRQGGVAAVRQWLADHPRVTAAAFIVLVGVIPDVDLLLGNHHDQTHSIGATAVIFAAVSLLPVRHRWRLALAAAAAHLSHLGLDWLGEDDSPPFGVMALWPFSREYFHSGLDLLPPVDRRYWLDGFLWRNLRTLAAELAVLAPLAIGAWWARREPAANSRRAR